jgi:hypothetical protein
MKRVLAAVALFVLAAAGAWAAPEGKTYDSAVSCKAFALLAKNAGDAKSLAVLKLIDAAIDQEIARGKTRAQADADVEYSRYDIKDNAVAQATIDGEWTACVARWSAP